MNTKAIHATILKEPGITHVVIVTPTAERTVTVSKQQAEQSVYKVFKPIADELGVELSDLVAALKEARRVYELKQARGPSGED